MRLQSVRDLKLELAVEVFAPLAERLLERGLGPKLGPLKFDAPLSRLALGIARGRRAKDFRLAIRLQSKSALVRKLVERIRQRVQGEIDVSFVGRLQPLADVPGIAELRAVCRPLVVGCSLAHVASNAGTLGMIARHRKTGRPVVLSNSHVLAQSGRAQRGDGITQPGPLDGGGPGNHIAALLDFAPLKLAGGNQVDAAIAVVDDSVELEPDSAPGVGAFTVADSELLVPGLKVRKLGRTTALTRGEVTVTELDDVAVDYVDVGTVAFDDQIEIVGLPDAPFSDRGDSGSLVFDEDAHAVGLLFAGNAAANDGAGVSYANVLSRVMIALDFVRY